MKLSIFTTTSAVLLASTALAASHVDKAALADVVRAELSADHDLSEFSEIEVRIRRNEIVIEAEGENVEVERTYSIGDDGQLGFLIEAEEEFTIDGVTIEREFEDGEWSEEIEEDDDDDDHDDDDDDDDDDDHDDDDDDDDDDEDDDDDDDEDY